MDINCASIATLCRCLGVSRAAYYQHHQQASLSAISEELIVKQVLKIRKDHPRMGGRKLYIRLIDFLGEHHIKIGRDKLFELLSANHLLIRPRKNRIKTTDSTHRFHKYNNLIEDFVVNGINQLWVSDITYWKVEFGFLYISFITDAYSHKIVGYQVANSLETIYCIQALEMAIKETQLSKYNDLIHHSDRGTQYCSKAYIELLDAYQIGISMTQSSDPLENPVAERVNGIIKNEYLKYHKVYYFKQAKTLLKKVVRLYNEERPHMSIENLTPQFVHENNLKTKKLWKTYYQKQPIQ